MVIFFTMVIFAPSSFFLGYSLLRMLYTYLSKIITVIFLWQVTKDITLGLNFS